MAKKKVKKTNKNIINKIDRFFMPIFLFALRVLPLKFLYIFGESIIKLAFFFLRERRDITMNNLRLALGEEKSEGEILEIYKSTIGNIGKGGVELLAYPRFHNGYLDKTISVEGREYLDEALKLGRGVILFSAHFGNFTYLIIKLALLGYPLFPIVRYPKQEGLTRHLENLEGLTGVKMIPDKPPRTCVEQSLKCLKENKVLFLLTDVNVVLGGIYVNFFGRMVPTFKGPIVMAMRTKAPIIPAFILREDGNRHRIIIKPPVKLELTGDKDKDIFTNLSRLSKIVESYIREYPDQWWWIHQRWRKALPKDQLHNGIKNST
ncbi:MAG: lysophospholipid acyltransferase family protein [Pseudomonadota bacterium]